MIAPGTVLQNRYLVVNQIGQGGMGTVYVATDQRFGSTVALKETLFTEPSLRKAFEREARLLHNLRHPALPKVTDHFNEKLTEGEAEVEGQFLVMDFIPGDDLSAMLAQRGDAFSPAEVMTWADQLLDALDYLHTQEPPVIHRDIKPQNLKLTSRNQIVLLDFGLAKGTPLQMSRVTNTGSVFGYSRNYAPIEQIQGAGTDTRSDLYSLGATLYHLLTGTTPPDALTRATAVLNGQPDPLRPANEARPHVSPAVAEVLARAMAQSSAQRPQTASEMREALRDASRQQTNLASEETILHAGVPAETAASALSEYDTQLMNAGGASPADNAGDAATKQVEAATTSSARPADSVPPRSADSVVTHLSPSRAGSPARSKNRAVFVAASVVILLLAASALAYTFMRNRANDTPPAETTTQTPAPATPQPSATVAPSVVEKQEESTKTAPAAVVVPTNPVAPRTRNASNKPTARDTAPAAQQPRPQPDEPRRADDPREFGREPQFEPQRPVPPYGLTPEEIQARRERRRAMEERRRAVRDMIREERQRRRRPRY